MQPSYVGNPDYRGYLSSLAQSSDVPTATKATLALSVVGNDGKVDPTKFNSPTFLFDNNYTNKADLQNFINSSYQQFGSLTSPSRVGTGTSGINPQFVNQSYDTKIAGLQGIYDTLDPQQNAANLNVQNQYTNQNNALQSQQAIGQRNLGIASQSVQDQKVKSLADLTNQVQTLGRSYQNQLGAYGAGDSSANGLINQALSGMASKNRANVMGSAADQGRQIDLQGQDLNTEFQNNVKTLDDWKNSSLNDIATKFLQQRQAIQQQMIGANADRYQALAQLDSNYVNQAISQLSALEGQYRQSSQDLASQYQNMQSPNVSIPSQLQQFAVNPISAGQISQLSSVPNVSSGNQPTAAALRKPFEQDFGFGLSPALSVG